MHSLRQVDYSRRWQHHQQRDQSSGATPLLVPAHKHTLIASPARRTLPQPPPPPLLLQHSTFLSLSLIIYTYTQHTSCRASNVACWARERARARGRLQYLCSRARVGESSSSSSSQRSRARPIDGTQTVEPRAAPRALPSSLFLACCVYASERVCVRREVYTVRAYLSSLYTCNRQSGWGGGGGVARRRRQQLYKHAGTDGTRCPRLVSFFGRSRTLVTCYTLPLLVRIGILYVYGISCVQ